MALIEDDALLDEVLRLAAAAGCEVERVPDLAALRPRWARAPLVLLDDTGLEHCAPAALPRRGGVMVVSAGAPPPDLWQRCVAVGVERVAELPGGEALLASALADVPDTPADSVGRVLGVVGGRGGAGASVLSIAVAQSAAERGDRALLVDCDPLGGGLDVTLGIEQEPGLRWPNLRVSGGRVPASALRSALPAPRGRGGLTVLSCDRYGDGPEQAAMSAVLDAGRRGGDTVVCDLPRQLTEAGCTVVDQADLVVLVVPADVRACAAARRVIEQVREHGAEPRLVVRGPAPGGLTPSSVARAVDLPLFAYMRPEPCLDAVLDVGRFPKRRRGPLANTADAILAALYESPASARGKPTEESA